MTRADTERGLRYLRSRIDFARRRIDREDTFALIMGVAFALVRGACQDLRLFAFGEMVVLNGHRT
jgi:hypothetical protein